MSNLRIVSKMLGPIGNLSERGRWVLPDSFKIALHNLENDELMKSEPVQQSPRLLNCTLVPSS